jgi:hypothetical protein
MVAPLVKTTAQKNEDGQLAGEGPALLSLQRRCQRALVCANRLKEKEKLPGAGAIGALQAPT